MSVNVRKGRPYTDQKYDWTQKGTDVSAMSFHKVMQTLYKADAMNEWGSIVALSYMAAQRVFPDYNDMADNKAYLESIARSFGYFFGRDKKVRVNTISQSPTPTTAGSRREETVEACATTASVSLVATPVNHPGMLHATTSHSTPTSVCRPLSADPSPAAEVSPCQQSLRRKCYLAQHTQ